MAHAQSVCRAPALSPAPARHLFADWRVLFGEWRRRVRGRRELAVLCDRCLRDIGVTRYDAEQEIRKPFWRG